MKTNDCSDANLLLQKKCDVFASKVKVIINAMTVAIKLQFDWNVTRNENVADIGALQIAYHTWHILTNGKDRSLPGLEALRPSQLFFISAAQVR